MPVAGDMRDPALVPVPDGRSRDVAAVQSNAARLGTPKAGQRRDELVLAVPGHAGNAEDLARAHFERDSANGVVTAIVAHVQLVNVEHDLARMRHAPVYDQLHVTPD